MSVRKESLAERRVTYSLLYEGRFYIIENVPARVDVDTGEEYFAPNTVEQLQATILGGAKPHHVVETPVYQFSG